MIKRNDLIRWLKGHGCTLHRQGARHEIWKNADGSARTPVPRHREVPRTTAQVICKQLGIDVIS